MLRKRTRSHQKDQQNMGQAHNLVQDSCSNESCYSNPDAFLKQKHKPNSFFTVPGLFVGLNPKITESDSVKSPTSPLDFKIFSKPNFSNFPIRASCKPIESTQKSWDCNKVGLSIIENLEQNESETRQMKILNKPSLRPVSIDLFSNSLPKNCSTSPHTHVKKSNFKLINPLAEEPVAKFWSHSLDSATFGSDSTRLTTRQTNLNPGRDLVASLSASEIELSEDYTCVRKHGPNPKTTHIFGDCILERHNNEFIAKPFTRDKHEIKVNVKVKPSEVANPYLHDDFLSFCYSCKKKLEGEDIYMYRGEKAFCSWNCRSEEILIEEEMEKNSNEAGSSSQTEIVHKLNSCEELSETSMFIAA